MQHISTTKLSLWCVSCPPPRMEINQITVPLEHVKLPYETCAAFLLELCGTKVCWINMTCLLEVVAGRDYEISVKGNLSDMDLLLNLKWFVILFYWRCLFFFPAVDLWVNPVQGSTLKHFFLLVLVSVSSGSSCLPLAVSTSSPRGKTILSGWLLKYHLYCGVSMAVWRCRLSLSSLPGPLMMLRSVLPDCQLTVDSSASSRGTKHRDEPPAPPAWSASSVLDGPVGVQISTTA